MSANRTNAESLILRTRVLWLATTLFLVVSDRTWGQTSTELPRVIFSIEENSTGGTEVGALAELYPELNNFRFSNRSRTTLFQVHPDTGVISVRDGAKLDFEKRPALSLTIVADIREEREDPYLAEFAESLRDEGFTSRALSRLIPLQQRIQVQVQLRDIEEADDFEAVSSSVDNIENAEESSNHEEPVTVTSGKQTDPQNVSHGPAESRSLIEGYEELSPDQADHRGTKTETATPESMIIAETSQGSKADVVSAVPESAVEDDVPMPSDLPGRNPEPSHPAGKGLTLSESSGQSVLQLNAKTAEGDAEVAANAPQTETKSTLTQSTKDDAPTEVPADLKRAVLVKSVVSLAILLGTVFLMRQRWMTFRKSLPRRSEQETVDEPATEVKSPTIVAQTTEDPDERKAADEFVNELLQEEAIPQNDEALQSVIAHQSDDEYGNPFDPESLIDDEYFNDADEFAALKARNHELGDRLQEKVGLVELAAHDRMSTENLSFSMGAEPSTINSGSETSLFEHHLTSDSGSEFAHVQIPQPAYNQDAVTPAEPRWSSDWPGYSEEQPSVTSVMAANTGAMVAAESNSCVVAEATDDKIASLRTELADLFAIQKKSEAAEAKSVPEIDRPAPQSVAASEDENKGRPCAEETHLESVAQYLSQLLERSRKEEAADAIFVDRRKSGEKTPGKWDGVDRRGGQKAKAPVQSYIESYLSEHGGELSQDSGTQRSSETSQDELSRPLEQKPLAERRPVDVQAIRQHMNSFRNVASTALEHALASHQIRQAKGKVAGRTTLVVGLTLVSVLAIATNSAMKIYFPSLGWLMGLIICLAIAELILRIEAIRRHRRELRYRILEPATKPGERSGNTETDGVAAATDEARANVP